MNELSRQTSFDPRPDSYEGFFDREWANSLFRATDETKLKESAFDLVRNWHAASNARSLPLIMTNCLKVAEERTIRENEPMDRRKIRKFTQRLVADLEANGQRVRPTLKKSLQAALERIDSDCDVALQNAREAVVATRPDLWDAFLGQSEFTTCLWALERLCYSSLYYNYEWFLTECIRIKRNDNGYRFQRQQGDFKDVFRAAFGPALQQECWSDQRVTIARYTRHALVHNGGRMTEVLRKQPHDLLVNGDEIQVGAPHTNALFLLLSKKVLALAEAASQMVEFQK